ncbi:MAG: hypothetical protein DWQ07_12965 [Chloroflexi bacterium]|nr:MAG: hypothetical protein DWQ07_12965 [Chloroflexota bacterium]MBL1196951.1 hypothetical protein [Chloroflexota bacterium]NOH14247.1 hypothetical protein [Chloroflexota bacterium]
MVKHTQMQFEGFDCVKLENEQLALWVTTSIGPRVLGLSAFGRENMFVILPDAKYDHPGRETYYFRGGHRLWYAPEKPEITYIPDNQAVAFEEIENGVKLVQPVDEPSGVQKSFGIRIADSSAEVEIDHFLTNLGNNPIDLAPWAITQLRAGGVGIFPQQTGFDDEHGLLPNRHLVLWPYTKINSPQIHWGDEAVYLEANMTEGALKIGFPNPAGWLAYALDGTLFVKRAIYHSDANYLDRRASSQCYSAPQFIELETLGAYVSLQPGETIRHQESWKIYSESKWPEEIAALYHGFVKE